MGPWTQFYKLSLLGLFSPLIYEIEKGVKIPGKISTVKRRHTKTSRHSKGLLKRKKRSQKASVAEYLCVHFAEDSGGMAGD